VAQTPARIVVVPMWSSNKTGWDPFRQAATHFADLLFIVAAGDDDKDIDIDPVWPATLGLPNMLVVSAIRVWDLQKVDRTNWGTRTVGAYAGVVASIDRRWLAPDNSRTATVLIADALAGCWSQLLGGGDGAGRRTALLAHAGKQWQPNQAPYIEACGHRESDRPRK
jgi:hypothetical protein